MSRGRDGWLVRALREARGWDLGTLLVIGDVASQGGLESRVEALRVLLRLAEEPPIEVGPLDLAQDMLQGTLADCGVLAMNLLHSESPHAPRLLAAWLARPGRHSEAEQVGKFALRFGRRDLLEQAMQRPECNAKRRQVLQGLLDGSPG